MDFKYGSTCYPKECDREVIVSRDSREGTDPVQVMAGINVRQQVREKSRYLNTKEVVWMQQATQRGVMYCRICSQYRGMDGILWIYNHRHHSSFVDRIFAHVDSYGRYFCIGCNENHPVKSGVRYNIVCSSSTLHNCRGNTSNNMYSGDYMHCDFDTIPGATIQGNMHSVHAQWGTSTLPVDILLMSGVNNLANGESVELIMDRYARFKEMVESIGQGDPTGKSTLAISMVIMPPRLTSFNTN